MTFGKLALRSETSRYSPHPIAAVMGRRVTAFSRLPTLVAIAKRAASLLAANSGIMPAVQNTNASSARLTSVTATSRRNAERLRHPSGSMRGHSRLAVDQRHRAIHRPPR